MPVGLSGVVAIASGDYHTMALIGAPLISAPVWIRTNGFDQSINIQLGISYRLQASADLTAWIDLTNFVGAGPTIQIRDASATNTTRRYYRVVSP